jgi:hypothetical protein
MTSEAPTPPSIAGRLPSRGTSSRDGQLRQAREKLDRELSEEGPTSNIRAFVKGFSAAATGSVMVGGIQEAMFGRGARQQALASLQDTSRIAQYLEEFHGKSPKLAAEEAVHIEKLLQSPAKWAFEDQAQNLMREVGGVVAPDGGRLSVLSMAQNLPDAPRSQIVDFVRKVPYASVASLQPEVSAEAREAVMGNLRARYKAPASAALRAKVLARRLMPLAVGATPLSLYGGFDAVRRNMDQKRRGKQ